MAIEDRTRVDREWRQLAVFEQAMRWNEADPALTRALIRLAERSVRREFALAWVAFWLRVAALLAFMALAVALLIRL